MTTKQRLPFWLWAITGLTLTLLVLNGCKDTGTVNEAGNLESCKILIDDQEWSSAIEVCEKVETDEGYHLTAQAYMGRSGIALFTLLDTLSGDNIDASTVLFKHIPDTTSDTNDYRSALQNLLTNMKVKDQIVYLESLILSGLLVFKELKTLLGLSVAGGVWSTCAGSTDSTMDFRLCTSWGPRFPDTADVSAGSISIFGGLGSDLYTNLCGANSHDSTFDSTYPQPIGAGTISSETTVDSCAIKVDSILDYNKTAYTNYTGDLKTNLEPLYYYEKFDTGQNFEVSSATGPTVSFCHTNYIALPDASDDIINDCEMLNFLTNPGF